MSALNNLYNKNILMVTAHQDDEVLFAGGLLLSLKDEANIYIACMSRPRRHRKDTATREKSFERVCGFVNAKEFYLTHFYDLGEYYKEHPSVVEQKKEMVSFVKKLVEKNQIDIIVTHNSKGEYGHFYHIVVNQVCNEVVSLVDDLSLITFGVNNISSDPSYTVLYNKSEKAKLFEFYEPHWNPSGYKFAYLPELFFIEEK